MTDAPPRPELPLARKMWRTLEPYHGMIYFVPERSEHYAKVGVDGDRSGYFASRSAPMGAVPADVVIATFFNFNPTLVRRAMDGVWDTTSPSALLDARLAAVDAALTRLLGADVLGSAELGEAAELARIAADACSPEGRPLYAGHAALPWPDEPHLALWHAITLLREYRGDGHVAALTADGETGCGALVMHAASGDITADALRTSRAWPQDEWDAACNGLRERGWIDNDARLTRVGWEHRTWVEDRTDELAGPPWKAMGDERADRLRELVRPWSRTISQSAFG